MATMLATHAPKEPRLLSHYVKLDDGRTVVLFVNRDTRLVTLGVAEACPLHGREVYHKNV